jgi:putative ABC transport system permease protein
VAIADKEQDANWAEPAAIPGVLDLGVSHGSISRLRPSQVAVSDSYASDHHLTMGSPIRMRFVDGTSATQTVAAIYKNKDFAGSMILPTAAYVPHTTNATIAFVMVRMSPGADLTTVRHAIDHAGKPLGAPTAVTRQGFVDETSGRIGTILSIVYVMLALSILIAVMGIANTMSLSIHERISELGLLRAVGQIRPQTRAMVRWEAVVISLFGTLAGVGVGVLLGWALVKGAAADDGVGVFAAPITRLVVILVLGGLVGVLAGLRPARRAARIDVLDAIATT